MEGETVSEEKLNEQTTVKARKAHTSSHSHSQRLSGSLVLAGLLLLLLVRTYPHGHGGLRHCAAILPEQASCWAAGFSFSWAAFANEIRKNLRKKRTACQLVQFAMHADLPTRSCLQPPSSRIAAFSSSYGTQQKLTQRGKPARTNTPHGHKLQTTRKTAYLRGFFHFVQNLTQNLPWFHGLKLPNLHRQT